MSTRIFQTLSWLTKPLYLSVGSSSKGNADPDCEIEDFHWDFIPLRELSKKRQGNSYLMLVWFNNSR